MWHKSKSTERPLEVQPVAYSRYLLHRNIEEKTVTDANGEERTEYSYEEKLVTEAEYKLIVELAERDKQISEMQEALTELASLVVSEV